MKKLFLAPALLALATSLILSGCSLNNPESAEAHYAPGLGDIMGATATRHSKLWFAGQAQNWALAAYELDELHEGFEDAEKYHPTHKHVPVPIPQLIASTMSKPLEKLDEAIKKQDIVAFTKHYDELTEGCNSCHRTSEFEFNIVTRPMFNPFANQAFTLPR